MHRGLEAFVDICIHLFYPFFRDQDPKTESRFSPKIMQICCKPDSLEDKDPKTESGLSPKIMQNTQDQVVWRIRIPKLNLDCPKILQMRCKPGSLEDKENKTESGPSSKIMQKQSKLGSLEDQDPKSQISKINFASWIRGFCRHLYTFDSSFF